MLLFVIIYLLLNLLLVREDLRHGMLPDRLTCPLLWSGLLWHCMEHTEFLPVAVIGAIVGYAAFALLYWCYRLVRGHEGLGYGDVKYLAALGAWHGWEQLPALVFIAALLACSLAGARALCTRSTKVLKNPLPFGPFLAAAGLLTGYQTLMMFNLRL
ncbi:prepilin peptidase [Vagococcus sp. WN89Y]|uniref:prepilin peptidase n=1 Tax=Vagococcus sp. WN89Y TaxID=3457258 RepID=UPI003FCE34F3